ncbi:hypothetical protein F2Q69_00048532 [Brassica cretica]|uniref:Uncharacterized protein n=1 Tax=Brassica cretica TaxID=69181 RepID=A0A8S9Q1B3_BRACR|nr:hypothetical protein F2Q69_00048532 [Brassica cretica]
MAPMLSRFETSQIPVRCMVSDLTVFFPLLKPEIRIYLIDGGIFSLLLMSLSVGEDLSLVLCGYGIWFLEEAVDLFLSSSLAKRFDRAIVTDVDVLVWLGDVPFRVEIAQDFCSLVQLQCYIVL